MNSKTTPIPSHSVTYKLIRHDKKKGILYFEGNWWMTESVSRELEFDRYMRRNWSSKYNYDTVYAPRPNKETREIELDKFLLPRGKPFEG